MTFTEIKANMKVNHVLVDFTIDNTDPQNPLIVYVDAPASYAVVATSPAGEPQEAILMDLDYATPNS